VEQKIIQIYGVFAPLFLKVEKVEKVEKIDKLLLYL